MSTVISVKNGAPNWPAMCEMKTRTLKTKHKSQIDAIKNTSASIWFDSSKKDEAIEKKIKESASGTVSFIPKGPKGTESANMQRFTSTIEDIDKRFNRNKANKENKFRDKGLYATKRSKTQLVRQCPDCQILFDSFHACNPP
jgi:hypothetical protein